MTIKVTADHIKRGRRAQCFECPVALALDEATGQFWKVKSASLYNVTSNLQIHNVPLSVTTFVRDFDDGRIVSPFEFEL